MTTPTPTPPEGESIGERIEALRKQQKLTQEELAVEAGTTKTRIWMLENGGAPRVSGVMVMRIARTLGVTADYLLDPEHTLEQARDTVVLKDYVQLPQRMKPAVQHLLRELTRLARAQENGE